MKIPTPQPEFSSLQRSLQNGPASRGSRVSLFLYRFFHFYKTGQPEWLVWKLSPERARKRENLGQPRLLWTQGGQQRSTKSVEVFSLIYRSGSLNQPSFCVSFFVSLLLLFDNQLSEQNGKLYPSRHRQNNQRDETKNENAKGTL